MKRHTFTPKVEVLESRLLPSVGWFMSGSTLKLVGDNAPDWISVEIAGPDVWFNGTGMTPQRKPTSQIRAIDIGGRDGSDTIEVIQKSPFTKPIRIYGENGPDVIKIDVRDDGSARFSADGGPGSDSLIVPNWMPAGTNGFPQSFWTNAEYRSVSALAQAQDILRRNRDMTNINRQISAPITSGPSNHSAATYQQTIEQFELGPNSHARYKWDRYGTKCNIAAGDVMRANGSAFPTKDDLGGIDGGGSVTAGAKRLNDWLNGTKTWTSDYPTGPEKGWRKIDMNSQADLDLLLSHIRAGKPAVASTASPNHIAVIRPDQEVSRLTKATLGQLMIAQAGRVNFNRGELATGWAGYAVETIEFFIHDPSGTPINTNKWVHASDLALAEAPSNGWGPVEYNQSNGELDGNDGRPLTLNGVTFSKGFGVHSSSNLRLNLDNRYSRFDSFIGVDDEVAGANGSVVFRVLGDGRELYRSDTMRGNSPTLPISIPVAGIYQLQLVVDDAGDGKNADHADWADAKLFLSSQLDPRVYASDLVFAAGSSSGYGPIERDMSNGEWGERDGRTISIGGRQFSKGLGVHSTSLVMFDLGGRYSKFESLVGVDDETSSYGSVAFLVFADGRKVFDSGAMTGDMGSTLASVDLLGVQRLALVVTDADDGPSADHADWGDATFRLA